MRTAVLAILFVLPTFVSAQSVRIDGRFEDWDTIPVAYTDAPGDGGSSGIDFGRLQITHDARHVFLRFDVGEQILAQEDNTMRLYIDTDASSSTGQQIYGIGAELTWNFANRDGQVRLGGSTRSVSHADIGLVPSPTMTTSSFEIALSREARVNGLQLFPTERMRVLLVVGEPGGDRLPDADGGVGYEFSGAGQPLSEEITMQAAPEGGARLLTWNTLQDGLTESQRQPAFARILKAVQPDIMCFQECFDASAGQVLVFVRSVLDPPAGRSWRTLKLDQGNVLITHYDIEESWVVQSGYRESAYLLSSPEGKKLLLLNCHFRCCGANEQRQEEADGVMEFLRDAKSPGGRVTLEEGTPIVLVGDLNLVGDRRQYETLITGDIADNTRYGADAPPDWDGGDWIDLVSRQPRSPFAYTWYNPGSSYAPARLDYLLYTAASMDIDGHMVINTADMSAEQRTRLGLQTNDSYDAADHFPRYADLLWKDATSVGATAAGELTLEAVWPQPARSTLQLQLSGSARTADVVITDVLGRVVYRGRSHASPRVGIDVSRFEPGPYILRLSTGRERIEKLIVVE
jgi:endonuclease/exonuclease/phosphatase family metal-dependent hydrolase